MFGISRTPRTRAIVDQVEPITGTPTIDTMMQVYNPTMPETQVPMAAPPSNMYPPVNRAGLITEGLLGKVPTPPTQSVAPAQTQTPTVSSPVTDTVPVTKKRRKLVLSSKVLGYNQEA